MAPGPAVSRKNMELVGLNKILSFQFHSQLRSSAAHFHLPRWPSVLDISLIVLVIFSPSPSGPL